jgi:predicted nuclease of predicted toxin-antitoxin system
MKLLLDENLSWRLVRLLKLDFPQVVHLINTPLNEASSDSVIWDYAKQNEYTIVTNDEDFFLLSLYRGFPPKVILLKTGNQSTNYIAEILIKHQTEIFNFIQSEEYGLLELF